MVRWRYSGQGTFVLNYARENKLGLPKGRRDFFASSNGDTDMGNSHGRFVWYELMTTDMKTAKLFYANVVGWGARDASAPALGYSLFTVADLPVAGLMNMPENGRAGALDWICRRRRCGLCGRPDQAAWGSGARPTDVRPRHQPLFHRRRSANGDACF